MKNIFAITFGTSDVQFYKDKIKGSDFEEVVTQVKDKPFFELKHKAKGYRVSIKENRNRKESYLPTNARIDGEIILHNITDFLPLIELPLTLPVIGQIKKLNPEIQIDHWFLVATDQDRTKVEDHHWKGDTLYFAQIFKKKLQSIYPEETDKKFILYKIENDLTNIDKQYLDFQKYCPNIFRIKEEEINQIFLLPQGGIDQINQALTLQLIQAYKTKVKQWQKAEDAEPEYLKFTEYFLNDLNKQKILKHLEDYDFGLIRNITKDGYNEKIFKLADFANRKLNLDYDGLDKSIKYYEEKTDENKARDLYIFAKMFYNKDDYGNYLWRLFTLLENIHRIKVDKVFGNTEELFAEAKKNPTKNSWINKINEYPDLVEILNSKTMGNKPLDWRVPNRFTYRYIYKFLISKGDINEDSEMQNSLESIFKKTNPLVEKRNDLAHYLRPITKEIIEGILKNVSVDDIHDKCDIVFKITKDKPFGIYDDIKKDLLTLL